MGSYRKALIVILTTIFLAGTSQAEPQKNLYSSANSEVSGDGQWAVEDIPLTPALQANAAFTAPISVLIDGKRLTLEEAVARGIDSRSAEKVMMVRHQDGMTLQVHYNDYSLEKTGDATYPYKVLRYMLKSYNILSKELQIQGHPNAPESIKVYLGDVDTPEMMPFGGFGYSDYQRAPLFMIRKDEMTGQKNPVILMPINYKKFLKFWHDINRIPDGTVYDDEDYLGTSIMHEMTHAVVHMYNENLGSTEYEVRDGDWYTEGLARYYETKIGVDAGFASEGFRRRVGDKIQFSRGGANYYLRFPDESFFTLRYENALFWLYFEKRFGTESLLRLTRALKHLPFQSTTSMYMQLMKNVTGLEFPDVLNEYFNWVYRGDYRELKEGRHLLPVARTATVWSDGEFHVYAKDGRHIGKSPVLNSDWVQSWGSHEATTDQVYVAGDWTIEADVKPLAFDAQEILISRENLTEPLTLTLRQMGKSRELKARFYFQHRSGTHTVDHTLGSSSQTETSVTIGPGITKVSVVLSNLDSEFNSEYEIVLN